MLRSRRFQEHRTAATIRGELLRFNGAVERDPAIDAWMEEHAGESRHKIGTSIPGRLSRFTSLPVTGTPSYLAAKDASTYAASGVRPAPLHP
ncbi:MAG TPA: hypothetical protein VEI52_03845 [Terriglobales bacterium]|nr:hypothetical protein [Terriglobales bacterium]